MNTGILYLFDYGTKTHNPPSMFGVIKVKVLVTSGKIIVFPLLIFLLFSQNKLDILR